MQFLWRYIDDLVGKGLEWNLIIELIFYASATFVTLALPLAILLSSIMTFGNLGEHYELVAMKSAGIPLRNIMKPLVILALFISIGAFYFSNNLLPKANLKFQTLYYDIRQKKLAFNIKEGIFYKDLEGYTIRIGKKERDDIHIKEVMIYDHTDKLGNINVTIAKSGKMETTADRRFLIFTLYDGYAYKEIVDVGGYREKRPLERSKFVEQQKKFDLSNFELSRTDENIFKDHYLMLNLKQLDFAIDSLDEMLMARHDRFSQNHNSTYNNYFRLDTTTNYSVDTIMLIDSIPSMVIAEDTIRKLSAGLIDEYGYRRNKKVVDKAINSAKVIKNNILNIRRDLTKRKEKILKHHAIWHEKFTYPAACLVLFFIGAPLGAIIRKGGLGMPVVISVIFFIIFHIITITGKKYVEADSLEPFIGMWMANVILLPIGIFLTWKATTDAPLLDAEIWIKKIKSVGQYILYFGKKPE